VPFSQSVVDVNLRQSSFKNKWHEGLEHAASFDANINIEKLSKILHGH